MRIAAVIFGSGLLTVIFASCGPKPASNGACGDNNARIQHRECTAASDEATCAQRGGSWVDSNAKARNQSCGPSGKCTMTEDLPIKFSCSCLRPDDGCPCSAASDCVGACYAPEQGDKCAPASAGTCGPPHKFGCKCLITEQGAGNMCI